MLEEIVVNDDAVGRWSGRFSVDSPVVCAHQHAAGARHKPAKGKQRINDSAEGDRLAEAKVRAGPVPRRADQQGPFGV